MRHPKRHRPHWLIQRFLCNLLPEYGLHLQLSLLLHAIPQRLHRRLPLQPEHQQLQSRVLPEFGHTRHQLHGHQDRWIPSHAPLPALPFQVFACGRKCTLAGHIYDHLNSHPHCQQSLRQYDHADQHFQPQHRRPSQRYQV